MKSDDDEPKRREVDPDLERRKFNLELDKHRVEVIRVELESARVATEQYRATTERLDRLIRIAEMYGERQADEVTVIEGAFEVTTYTRRGVELSGHEEDLYVGAMREVKRLLSIGRATQGDLDKASERDSA